MFLVHIMSRLKANPNIDIKGLKKSKISFIHNMIIDNEKETSNKLVMEVKRGKSVLKGTMFDKTTVEIIPISKRGLHKGIFNTLTSPKHPTTDREIKLNGKKLGVLKEAYGLRKEFLAKSLPIHGELKHWETLYYDKSSREIQVYFRGDIFAVAKLEGMYHVVYIKKLEYLDVCLALMLASMDSVFLRK